MQLDDGMLCHGVGTVAGSSGTQARKESGMNAAKRIKKMMDEPGACRQLAVLKQLALALELALPFEPAALQPLDAVHFALAQQLLADWHAGRHIDARGRLIERLLAENPALMRPAATTRSAARQPLARSLRRGAAQSR